MVGETIEPHMKYLRKNPYESETNPEFNPQKIIIEQLKPHLVIKHPTN